jgi:hypothetical protein
MAEIPDRESGPGTVVPVLLPSKNLNEGLWSIYEQKRFA